MDDIQCGGFTFIRNFDSANLARVELVSHEVTANKVTSHSTRTSNNEIPEYEFKIWTTPDCGGTEYENGNRTWFYFGVKANNPSTLIKFNIVDLNRQAKMYSQGMCPVYKIVPSKNGWERIRDKPSHTMTDDIFTLSFKYKMPENLRSTTYFAFTYPLSYNDIQKMLTNIDVKLKHQLKDHKDDIYYTRECVAHSLDGRRIDLLTITSKFGMSDQKEVRLKNLFPEENQARPFRFPNKKIIFITARVHPGETPSSFVFNGLLHLLLNRDDQIALQLRRMYVFKMMPCLNPDGVARGHYRTDSRGVNLNRVYLNPSRTLHPSIYAARTLIRYYHFGCEKPDVVPLCLDCLPNADVKFDGNEIAPRLDNDVNFCKNCGISLNPSAVNEMDKGDSTNVEELLANESNLFLYMDFHGHASKKGIFIYGNHFKTTEQNVECMLLAKLMSINNHHFHFTACNFSERNMFVRDKRDGMSRAGSGRVAVSTLTGLIKSYTLECNYNTGRIVNVLPPTIKERQQKGYALPMPPKYSPSIYEEVGRSLGASILDLTGNNPLTRLPHSEFHSLNGVIEWLRLNYLQDYGETSNAKSKFKSSSNFHAQVQFKHKHP